jgi:hypothetical protein
MVYEDNARYVVRESASVGNRRPRFAECGELPGRYVIAKVTTRMSVPVSSAAAYGFWIHGAVSVRLNVEDRRYSGHA